MNVRERQRAEINPMQYGTIVHYILERFFGEYTKEEYLSLEEDKFQKLSVHILRNMQLNISVKNSLSQIHSHTA